MIDIDKLFRIQNKNIEKKVKWMECYMWSV